MAEPPRQDVGLLVTQASSGDPGAMHELIERYLPALDAYVARHAGGALLRKESRSDVVQSTCREVLEDLARGAFTWRGEPQFRQWLYEAALHKIQMKARRWQAQRRDADREVPLGGHGSGGSGPADDALAASATTPSGAAVDREERERFAAALARLEPEQRRLVEWSHFDGLSHKEIAERLGINEGHSRVLLSRALARLARFAAERD